MMSEKAKQLWMDMGREGRRDSEGKEADPGGGNERGQVVGAGRDSGV